MALERIVGSKVEAVKYSSSESSEYYITFFSLVDGVANKLSSPDSLKLLA